MEKNFRNHPDKDPGKLVDWEKLSGTTTAKRVDIWAESAPVGIAIERLQQLMDRRNR